MGHKHMVLPTVDILCTWSRALLKATICSSMSLSLNCIMDSRVHFLPFLVPSRCVLHGWLKLGCIVSAAAAFSELSWQFLGSSMKGTPYLKLFCAWLKGYPPQMLRCETVDTSLSEGQVPASLKVLLSFERWKSRNANRTSGEKKGGLGVNEGREETRSFFLEEEDQLWGSRGSTKSCPLAFKAAKSWSRGAERHRWTHRRWPTVKWQQGWGARSGIARELFEGSLL